MSTPNDSIKKTIIVALSLCVVCSVFVSTAAVGLKGVQQTNKKLDLQRNVLLAAGLVKPGEADKATVNAMFKQIEVRVVDLDTGEFTETDPATFDQRKASKDPAQSKVLKNDPASIKRLEKQAKVYLVRKEGKLESIILPIRGYGLWSTLYGFLALAPDANTVIGLGFYEHAETPGLGGEVDNPRWKGLWPGKEIFGDSGEVAIEVMKGAVDPSRPGAEHQIDGLAGATLTSVGVSNLVRFWVGDAGFGPFLDRIRKGGA